MQFVMSMLRVSKEKALQCKASRGLWCKFGVIGFYTTFTFTHSSSAAFGFVSR